MTQLVQGNSVIRALFEEGKEMAREVGAENVYDFSLGNPSVPAPEAVRTSMKRILDGDNSLYVHGYMSNAGYEEVREAVAASLNKRFGTCFDWTGILMTVGAAGGLNVVLRTILDPGDEVICFAPFFGEYTNYVHNLSGKSGCDSTESTDIPAKCGNAGRKDYGKDKGTDSQ